jgi:hypothetical protein
VVVWQSESVTRQRRRLHLEDLLIGSPLVRAHIDIRLSDESRHYRWWLASIITDGTFLRMSAMSSNRSGVILNSQNRVKEIGCPT